MEIAPRGLRVGLVHGSAALISRVRGLLRSADEPIELLWGVSSGEVALQRCQRVLPDVVLVDLNLEAGAGLMLVRQLRELLQEADPRDRLGRRRCVVLGVVSSLVRQAPLIVDAIAAGVSDVVLLREEGGSLVPGVDGSRETGVEGGLELLQRLQRLQRLGEGVSPSRSHPFPSTFSPPLIALGASTGGPAALVKCLSGLPLNFGGAVLVVQHIDSQFVQGLAEWLNSQVPLPVRLAFPGDRPQAGQILLAQSQNHLILLPSLHLGYTAEPQDYPFHPSVNVLFGSLAHHWPQPGLAFLLTGMGRDGAQGLKQLRDRGWYTAAQDAASCSVYGMPKAAVEVGAACASLTPQAMADVCRQRIPARGDTVSRPGPFPGP